MVHFQLVFKKPSLCSGIPMQIGVPGSCRDRAHQSARSSVEGDRVYQEQRSLIGGRDATTCYEQVLVHAEAQHLVSDKHFTVGGTLIEAWDDQKSFKKKTESPLPDHLGNPSTAFRRE